MSEEKNKKNEEKYLDVVFKLLYLIIALMMLVGILVYINIGGVPDVFKSKPEPKVVAEIPAKAKGIKSEFWIAPDTLLVTGGAQPPATTT